MSVNVKKLELKIDEKIEQTLPKLTQEEFEALKQSIAEKGLLEPIKVMPDGTVVDGHHRLKACKELGIEPVYQIIDVTSVEDAILYTITVNAVRRQLSNWQKAKVGYRLLQIERQKAEERKLSTLKKGNSREAEVSLTGEKGKATEIVAKKIGLSRYKFEQCVEIIEHAPKEIQDLVEQEKLSIKTAYELTITLENEEVPVPKKIKKELWRRVLDSENPSEEAKKVVKIVVNTNTVKELIEMEDEEIAKKIKETWEDKFYTEQLDVDEVRDNINVWTGGTGKLVKVYLPYQKFADEENPDEIAARYFAYYGGQYLDKITAEVYVGEVNKFLWKKRDELDEEFKKQMEKVRKENEELKRRLLNKKSNGEVKCQDLDSPSPLKQP